MTRAACEAAPYRRCVASLTKSSAAHSLLIHLPGVPGRKRG